MKPPTLNELRLDRFDIAPPQTLGAVRLFPIIDRHAPDDLRLGIRSYDPGGRRVELSDRTHYTSYIPHGLVLEWTTGNETRTQQGTALGRRDPTSRETSVFYKMARRAGDKRLRLLPLHVALEGFLALEFNGPPIAWTDYSKEVIRRGLGVRREKVIGGDGVDGLDEALRLFEIHEHQVGMVVFVADAVAQTFVAGHPDDYRLLHHSLIDDMYAEIFTHYSNGTAVGSLDLMLNADGIDDLSSLQRGVDDVLDRWNQQTTVMAGGLLDQPITSEPVYQSGQFSLQRFRTPLGPDVEGHIGEVIVDRQGRIRYLKTLRLSKSQVRRAALLELLGRHDWNLDEAAAAEGHSRDDLIVRMNNAGFGYTLNPEVLAATLRKRRR
jgi:hypothetical protein